MNGNVLPAPLLFIYKVTLLMVQAVFAAHKLPSNLFQLFSPNSCTTREEFSSQQRQEKRIFVLLCLGKAYLLICCSELHLQSTTKAKPSALIAAAQVEYFLLTLSPASVGLYTLSSTSELQRRVLLFTHHCCFIAAVISERREKNLSDFLLFRPGLLRVFSELIARCRQINHHLNQPHSEHADGVSSRGEALHMQVLSILLSVGSTLPGSRRVSTEQKANPQ